ncbi:hypothetical protein E0Z10_g6399 [Xylaria hypoxylon]|uniref:Uncharacterized protein n=1 Tax=Xylaria hypoxylon TaxID=37992 RepID=A0A4Z0YEC8_9PEZI|nr:hypothetical protein E0Z10_g6399 [Xylaria hypoxylon]
MEPHREASYPLLPIEPSSPVLPTSELSPRVPSESSPEPSPNVPSNLQQPSHSASPPSPPQRSPLPIIWHRSQVNRKLTKTEKEKIRGDKLKEGNEGVDATTPCKRCSKLGKTCRVARDPSKFNTYKCGECIKGKCTCTFNIENPGIDYGSHHKTKNQAKEQLKRRARLQALATKRKNSDDTEDQDILSAAEVFD